VMNENISLGRIAGIHVGFNWSLLVIAALIAWSLATSFLPSTAPGHTSGAYWAAGVISALVFLASLLAHELAHSWSGNLVSNATWSDFWLNEGFTVYLERRIVEKVYGKNRASMEALLGRRSLEREIADLLNERGLVTDLGRPWTRGTVHQVLINEKYIGNNIWNRRSFKLKRKRVRNGPDMWIRANGVFAAVVDEELFEAAQAIIRTRYYRLSDDEMLDILRRLLEQHGYLSGLIIDEAERAPSSSAYQSRFGSLLRAYELVGFTPDRDYRYIEINRALRRMHPNVVADAISGIERAGGRVEQDPATDLLTINGEFTASIVVVRCRETAAGSLRWHIRFDVGLWPDLTVALRMDEGNQQALDYYLLPRIDMTGPHVRLATYNGLSLDSYRFDSLESLFVLAARAELREVA